MIGQGWLQRRLLLGLCVLTLAHSWVCWWISPALKPAPQNDRPYALVVAIPVLVGAGLMVWPGTTASGSRFVEPKP